MPAAARTATVRHRPQVPRRKHHAARSSGSPEEALNAVMATASQLYQAGRYPEVEVLCRGLIAADHKYWWSYSLYAAALRKLGRLAQGASTQVEQGPGLRARRAEAAC